MLDAYNTRTYERRETFLPRVNKHFSKRNMSIEELINTDFTEEELNQIIFAHRSIIENYEPYLKKKVNPPKSYLEYVKNSGGNVEEIKKKIRQHKAGGGRKKA